MRDPPHQVIGARLGGKPQPVVPDTAAGGRAPSQNGLGMPRGEGRRDGQTGLSRTRPKGIHRPQSSGLRRRRGRTSPQFRSAGTGGRAGHPSAASGGRRSPRSHGGDIAAVENGRCGRGGRRRASRPARSYDGDSTGGPRRSALQTFHYDSWKLRTMLRCDPGPDRHCAMPRSGLFV